MESDGAVASVDLQAFEPEPPTYDNAFPALSDAPQDRPAARSIMAQGAWQPKFQTRQSKCTQVFTVPLEERKFKALQKSFGDESDQMKICKDIMLKTNVSIELSLAKDQSMTVVINGKTDDVMKARRDVVTKLQTQASIVLDIPREYHRFILGKSGKKLQEIELSTATKVSLSRADDKTNPNEIRISGSKEGIDKARHEIEAIHEEQAKLAFERLPIPKIYHPFVCGPNRENIAQLEKTGAKISVSPHNDEIVVSGEKEAVLYCKKAMMDIYEDKKRKCQTVSVEVSKSQHKYVVGPRYVNIQEILANTGVSVEVPDPSSPSETITLRGEQIKLGVALTEVYSKANSVVFDDVAAPAWLHRFIIGRKGTNIKEITENFPAVHINFTEGQDKITVEGPPEEVNRAKDKLNAIVFDLKNRMDFAEIQVDQKFHKHIIGKSGANVTRIKQETGVSIKIPNEDSPNSNIIRLEGDPKGVQIAKDQLLEMATRMENEKTRDVIIEHRFHRQIIGAKGENIRKIRDEFNQVQITFPDPGKKSDIVTLRGPKTDVDKAYKSLQSLAKDLVENNYQAQVRIFKDFHKNIIGKGGITIKKIREETDTRIDLPSENSDSDVITITGKKANVEKAQAKIEAIQKEMGDIKEAIVEIPQRLHNSLIGAKGKFIRSVMEECGGVIIRFPQEGSKSDKVVIRGPSGDVENAKQQLMELAMEKKENSFTDEIKAKPQYHKFLIGKGGLTIKKVRESTGVRIIFPANNDPDQETITMIGKEDGVKAAKLELESQIKDLDNVVEGEISVDPKHHRHFVQRRGEVLRQIAEDYGGVIVSFPRSGVNSDRVVIKGAKDCVEAAKKKLLEIVEDLDAQVTIECVISQTDHRTIMGAGGTNVREITKQYDVGIKFPDKPVQPVQNGGPPEEHLVNGDGHVNGDEGHSEPLSEPHSGPRKCDIIIITGKQENCENAKQALLDLVPVTEECNVPFEYHRFVIGQRGRDVRKLMQDYDVNISIPPADEQSDVVKVRGPPANVTRAKTAILERLTQLEGEKEDRALRSFQLTLEIDEKYHPKIIGRRGQLITTIRKKHDVNIQFPDKGSENQSLITISGYEEKAEAARDEILQIVKDIEDMYVEEVKVDARIHPRIIGAKGRGINRIMEDFSVDLRFPRQNDPDPNLVTISGSEDNVLDCKDYLLNLEEEYLQDFTDQEHLRDLQRPPSKHNEPRDPRAKQQAPFVVKNAPWDKAPDTESQEDFPSFGAVVAPKGRSWGPIRK